MVPILSGSDIVSGHLVCTFLMQVLLVYRWPKACDSVGVCVCLCVCVTGHFRAAPLYSRPSQIFLHDRCRVAFSDDGCVHGDALFLSLIFAGRLGAASLSSQQSKAVGCCGMFQTQGLTWLSCGRVALSSYLRTEPLLQVTWSVTSPAGQPQPQTPFCILVFFSRV